MILALSEGGGFDEHTRKGERDERREHDESREEDEADEIHRRIERALDEMEDESESLE